MAGFTLDEPMSDIIFSGMLQGFGIGTTFVPLSTVTFATLARHDRGYGTSLFSLFRNVGSSIGIALAFAYEAHMTRSEEHTSELQSLMRNSYAVFCLKKKKYRQTKKEKQR